MSEGYKERILEVVISAIFDASTPPASDGTKAPVLMSAEISVELLTVQATMLASSPSEPAEQRATFLRRRSALNIRPAPRSSPR